MSRVRCGRFCCGHRRCHLIYLLVWTFRDRRELAKITPARVVALQGRPVDATPLNPLINRDAPGHYADPPF